LPAFFQLCCYDRGLRGLTSSAASVTKQPRLSADYSDYAERFGSKTTRSKILCGQCFFQSA
jgi:hypothetical protein